MKNKVTEELKQHFRQSSSTAWMTQSCSTSSPQEEIFSIVDLMIAKVDDRLKDRDMGIELRPAGKNPAGRAGLRPGARRQARCADDQREIEDNLSEKILFGELKAGQIVMVDAEGTGRRRSSPSRASPKPDAVPDAPPAEIETRAATTGVSRGQGTGNRRAADRRIAGPAKRGESRDRSPSQVSGRGIHHVRGPGQADQAALT